MNSHNNYCDEIKLRISLKLGVIFCLKLQIKGIIEKIKTAIIRGFSEIGTFLRMGNVPDVKRGQKTSGSSRKEIPTTLLGSKKMINHVNMK